MSSGARGPSAALVIPALDEEAALGAVLSEVPAELFDLICVVDNGSSDGTARVAREFRVARRPAEREPAGHERAEREPAKREPAKRIGRQPESPPAGGVLVVSEPRRGYGNACQAGVRAVRERLPGLKVLAFVDADHSDHPEDLADVLAPVLRGEAELSLGNRMSSPASRAALLPQARFGNRLACALMRWLFGARYADLGPMRAIEVGAFDRLELGDPNFGWTIEMQLKAHSQGLRVREVPVRYRTRIGASKITGTLRGTLGAGCKILGWIGAWRLATLTRPRRSPRSLESSRSEPRGTGTPSRTTRGGG